MKQTIFFKGLLDYKPEILPSFSKPTRDTQLLVLQNLDQVLYRNKTLHVFTVVISSSKRSPGRLTQDYIKAVLKNDQDSPKLFPVVYTYTKVDAQLNYETTAVFITKDAPLSKSYEILYKTLESMESHFPYTTRFGLGAPIHRAAKDSVKPFVDVLTWLFSWMDSKIALKDRDAYCIRFYTANEFSNEELYYTPILEGVHAPSWIRRIGRKLTSFIQHLYGVKHE